MIELLSRLSRIFCVFGKAINSVKLPFRELNSDEIVRVKIQPSILALAFRIRYTRMLGRNESLFSCSNDGFLQSYVGKRKWGAKDCGKQLKPISWAVSF